MLSLKTVYGRYFFVITVKDTMEGKRDRCITRRTLRPIVPHSAKAERDNECIFVRAANVH